MTAPTADTPAPGTTESTATDSDPELTAIGLVLSALSGLRQDVRQRVIDYVFQRLGLQQQPQHHTVEAALPPHNSHVSPTAHQIGATPHDIRTLKEQKHPRSAVEMATLVAYYLAELAPTDARKSDIDTADINKYFKQAGFPLPGRPRTTLSDAKSAGYLDSAAHGSYRLNPVGHNLIAHGLPAAGGDVSSQRARGSPARKKGATQRGRRK